MANNTPINIPDENKFAYNDPFMGPRVDFRPDAFDKAIRQKGYRVIWQQGIYCSCYSKSSGQPDYNCPVCKGKGYVYFGDTETRALITSIKGKKEQEHPGLEDKGAAYLTPLSTDDVGFRDRFTFVDFTMKYSEVINRSPNSTDILRYKSIKVVAVRQLNTVYQEGTDFTILDDRYNLKWLGINNPEIGTPYSLLYTTRPVYIATNPIHELRGTYNLYKGGGDEYFVALPKQFQIRREDILENEYKGY